MDKTAVSKQDVVNTIQVKTDTVPVTPEKEQVVVADTSLPNRRKSILSLKSLTEKKEYAKKKKVSINYDDLPKTPFTKSQFTDLWQQNVEKLNARNEKLLASLLRSVSYKIKNDFKIELTLPNARMQQEIEKSKGKVLNFLREKLNNYGIDFKYIVNEEEEKKFAYTPQEKYEFLKEKNPLLSELRRKLDLDV